MLIHLKELIATHEFDL